MLQFITTTLQAIQKLVLPRRNGIIWFLNIVTVCLLLAVFGTFFQASKDFSVIAPVIYALDSKLGIYALILYILTLLPGLIARLRWFLPITMSISSILLPFRRQLGVMMFVVVYVHMAFASTLPQLVMNDFDMTKIVFENFEWMGIVAWWVLWPLWLTSNDVSVRFMGKWWKRLHKLTYVSLFLIFLHVALQYESLGIVVAVIGILEVVSWLRERERRAAVSAPVTAS